jgi:predicted ATPase
MSSAHGGQVVVSPSTVALLEPESVHLRDLGQHRLKDLSAPIPLYQLQIDGSPIEFPPLKTLYRSNLPVPATPFLGRERELGEVVGRLADPGTRLLTLTGPGGTGKTRLALQAAAEVASGFPDGVFWVALAPLRDSALVVTAVVQALEVSERADEEPAATLGRALLGKRTLVVLDNIEHLLPAAAAQLAAVAAVCPTLRLLVTSRERLQLQVESVWPVPPLSEHDGERLFVERARAAGVELVVDDALIELCRRLDELPLALELAAARTVVFGPRQLLDRLGARLDFLKAGRDADPRQLTLRATIDWSYELLDDEEKRAFRALSVFRGGCSYEAAEEICGAELDTLQSLLDKSLLRRRDGADAEPRFWMLQTIRAFAREHLEQAGELGQNLSALQSLGIATTVGGIVVVEHARVHSSRDGIHDVPVDL